MIKTCRIYLAGPFFNERERAYIRFFEDVLQEVVDNLKSDREGSDEEFKVYSPSRDGIKLNIKTSTYADRERTFDDNVHHIDSCDLVVAWTSTKDTGTLWEVGYARSINKKVIEINDRVAYHDGSTHIAESEVYNTSPDTLESKKTALITKLLRELRSYNVAVIRPGYTTGGIRLDSYIKYVTSKVQLALLDSSKKDLDTESSVVSTVNFSIKEVKIVHPTYNRPFDFSAYDLVALCIDDKDPIISMIIGDGYRKHRRHSNLVTFSSQNYGVNIMLMHSVLEHFTDPDKLAEYIIDCAINDKVRELLEDHVVNAKEFE